MSDRRRIQISDKSVLVFKLVADDSVRPGALQVVALVFEPRAVHVGENVKWKIDVAERGGNAGRLHDVVFVQSLVVVLEASKAMLPTRGPGKGQFRAAQQIVLPRALLHVRRNQRLSVEVPFPLYPGATVGMPRAHPEQGAIA